MHTSSSIDRGWLARRWAFISMTTLGVLLFGTLLFSLCGVGILLHVLRLIQSPGSLSDNGGPLLILALAGIQTVVEVAMLVNAWLSDENISYWEVPSADYWYVTFWVLGINTWPAILYLIWDV